MRAFFLPPEPYSSGGLGERIFCSSFEVFSLAWRASGESHCEGEKNPQAGRFPGYSFRRELLAPSIFRGMVSSPVSGPKNTKAN